jgi:vacuolar-type H+-ATPase subunit H
MENINDHIARIYDQISAMDDLIDASRATLFSGKLAVDKNALFDIMMELRGILEDINKDLPGEIKQARRIISDSNKMIDDAKNKAAMIVKTAEQESERLVEDHELVKKASVQATHIIDEARRNAREFRKNAVEYGDETLAKIEDSVRTAMEKFGKSAVAIDEQFNETINAVYETRKDLRGA